VEEPGKEPLPSFKQAVAKMSLIHRASLTNEFSAIFSNGRTEIARRAMRHFRAGSNGASFSDLIGISTKKEATF
jgi:hypothetical protein